MSKVSGTDWERLAAMEDKDIDTSDIPELDEDFFQSAELTAPPKQSVTLRIDSDVLMWFKLHSQGFSPLSTNCCMRIWKASGDR